MLYNVSVVFIKYLFYLRYDFSKTLTMKRLFLASIVFFCFYHFSAIAQKDDPDTYVSHNGTTFKVGQKVTLGLGTGTNGDFRYVVKITLIGLPDNSEHLTPEYATHEVTITKIRRAKGTFFSKEAPTVFLVFKPDQQVQAYGINIEPALLAKEVITPVSQ